MSMVYATLPNGKKVQHGKIQYGVFTRTLPSNYIRYSDRSFCINTTVLPILQKNYCSMLEFIWCKATERVLYRIPFEKAMQVGEIFTHENGEKNLRIPIAECSIKDRKPSQRDVEIQLIEIQPKLINI